MRRAACPKTARRSVLPRGAIAAQHSTTERRPRVNLDEVELLREDFRGLPLGSASSYPHTAEGEYHVVDRHMGRWTEATIHYSWNERGSGNWKLLEEGGRRVMAHAMLAPAGPPMLTTGEPWWGDYVFEAEMRPLSFEGSCGLIVRYQDCRCYDAVRITRGQIALLHRHHAVETLLASRGLVFDVDRYTALRVECVGPRISVSVDGERLLEGEEREYLRGKVGLWSQVPARFADPRVTTSRRAAADAEALAKSWRLEEQALQSQHPTPVLWKKLVTPGFGADRNLRFGDLTGDGRPEIVLSQRVDMASDNYPAISCLTALTLDGEVLWQLGEPTPSFRPATSDNCFQVYDLDGDGCAEVLFCKDLRLWVADGCTGDIRTSAPTPRSRPSTARGGRPYERIMGDSLAIANLSGGPRPQEILLKDRYAHIWALDGDLRELWHRECVTGHFPAVYDIDGDGCDEVMAGYSMLDQDGTLLWELPFGDHQDAIAVGRFDPERPDTLLIGLAAGEEGFILATSEGEVLAQHKLGHVQKLAVANLRPDLQGLEYAIVTFWGHPGTITVFDCSGRALTAFEPVPYASPLMPVNWIGDGSELLFLSAHPTEGGLLDAHGHRAVMFPDDGHPFYCCTALDLTGDGRDELLTWDTDSIWIYRADAPLPDGPTFRPARPPRWNESNYMAHVSLPCWEP
jgi:rhamnogalacturonan endolyase